MKLEVYKDPARAALVREEIRILAVATFTVDPYLDTIDDCTYFLNHFDAGVRTTEFRCCVLRDADELIGYAYGHRAFRKEPPNKWATRLLETVGEEVAATWIRDQFTLVSLAVRDDVRGRGLGAKLHDAILALTKRPRAWLVTYAFDCPALYLYQRRGWQTLATGRLGSNDKELLVLGKELRPASVTPGQLFRPRHASAQIRRDRLPNAYPAKRGH